VRRRAGWQGLCAHGGSCECSCCIGAISSGAVAPFVALLPAVFEVRTHYGLRGGIEDLPLEILQDTAMDAHPEFMQPLLSCWLYHHPGWLLDACQSCTLRAAATAGIPASDFPSLLQAAGLMEGSVLNAAQLEGMRLRGSGAGLRLRAVRQQHQSSPW